MGPVAARQGHGDGARLGRGQAVSLQLRVRIRPGEENKGQTWLGSAVAMGPGEARLGRQCMGGPRSAGSMAGQGRGELETSLAAALLGQGLMAPGVLTGGPGPWAGWRESSGADMGS